MGQQLEEMIEEGKGELKLIDVHFKAKTWEAVAEMERESGE